MTMELGKFSGDPQMGGHKVEENMTTIVCETTEPKGVAPSLAGVSSNQAPR